MFTCPWTAACATRSTLAMMVFNGNPWHGGDHSCRPVPPSLKNTSSVFVRNDRLQGSLAPKYIGPFKVLGLHKHFSRHSQVLLFSQKEFRNRLTGWSIHGHSDNKSSDISSTVSPFLGLEKGIVKHSGSWNFRGAAGGMRSTPTLCTTAHQFIYTLTVLL